MMPNVHKKFVSVVEWFHSLSYNDSPFYGRLGVGCLIEQDTVALMMVTGFYDDVALVTSFNSKWHGGCGLGPSMGI